MHFGIVFSSISATAFLQMSLGHSPFLSQNVPPTQLSLITLHIVWYSIYLMSDDMQENASCTDVTPSLILSFVPQFPVWQYAACEVHLTNRLNALESYNKQMSYVAQYIHTL